MMSSPFIFVLDGSKFENFENIESLTTCSWKSRIYSQIGKCFIFIQLELQYLQRINSSTTSQSLVSGTWLRHSHLRL